MTVLTRMPLNVARRGARTLLGSPQAMHAAVLAAFPPGPNGSGNDGRVLWRVDRTAPHHTLLYLLSPERPDLTHMLEQAGWPTNSTWETRDYQPLLDRLQAGQRWAFRLTANPVRQVRPTGQGRGVVKAHVTAEQQVTWLQERAEDYGFRLALQQAGADPCVSILERRTATFPRQGKSLTVVMVTYHGLLEVADADRLRQALVTGLGRAKAYGCGLLTLAAPSN